MSGQKLVSIDFGGKYIHIVEGNVKSGGIEIQNAFLINTPVGSYSDGRLEDTNIIKEAVRTALVENKIKTKRAVFTTQSSSVITRELILPELKTQDLENAVKFEMDQYLPSTHDGYIFESKVNNILMEDGVRKNKIRAAAMPSSMVDGYYKLALDLKLVPEALDIHSNSISKLFVGNFSVNGENYPSDTTYVFIDMGSRTTTVNFITNGKLEFSRILSFGGREIDAAIARKYELSLEKAEQKKVELKINEHSINSDDYYEDTIKNTLLQQVLEIQKLFQFYTNRGVGSNIKTIFLYGGCSELSGIVGFINSIVNIKVIKIEHLGIIKRKPNMEPGLNHFLNATAALIRY